MAWSSAQCVFPESWLEGAAGVQRASGVWQDRYKPKVRGAEAPGEGRSVPMIGFEWQADRRPSWEMGRLSHEVNQYSSLCSHPVPVNPLDLCRSAAHER